MATLPAEGGLTIAVTPPSPEPWILPALAGAIATDGVERLLVLVPSSRARTGIVRSLAARAPRGAFLPRIESLSGFAARAALELPERPVLWRSGMRRALLAGLVDSPGNERAFGRLAGARSFPGVIRAIDHFFEALDRHKIRERAHLAALVRRYRAGASLPLDEEILKLYAVYRERTGGGAAPDGRPAATASDVLTSLARTPDALERALGAARLVVWTGFHSLSPAQIDLVRASAGTARRVLFVLELPAEPEPDQPADGDAGRLLERLRPFARRVTWTDAPADPVGVVARRLMPGAGAAFGAQVLEPAQPIAPGRLSVAAHASPAREVEAIAHQLAACLHAEGRHPDTLAASFADPALYLPLVREILPQYAVPFDADIGVPLRTVPPVALLLAALRAVENGFHRSEIELILRSPYVAPAAAELQPEQLDALARQAAVIGGDPEREWLDPIRRFAERRRRDAEAAMRSDVEGADRTADRLERDAADADRAADALGRFFGRLVPLADARERPIGAARFRTLFLALITDLGIPAALERTIDSPALRPALRRDLAALARVGELLDEMAGALSRLGPGVALPLAAWIDRLEALLVDESIVPMEETRGGVPVVRLTDLRLLPADVVFIGGLTESAFPRPRARHLFYPPTGDPERDFLEHDDPGGEDTSALLGEIARRAAVHLSWPRRVGVTDQLRAPLIDRLEEIASLPGPPLPSVPRPLATQIEGGARRAGADPRSTRATFEGFLRDPRSADTALGVLHGLRVATLRHHEVPSAYTGLVEDARFAATAGAAFRPGGSHTYSVTELERYAGCPFAFFSARVLRLAEMEEVEEEISPLTRGRLLHAILHRFHKERLDAGAPPLAGGDVERARRDLHRIAAEILAELPRGNLLWEATRAGLVAGCDPESGAGVRRSGTLSTFLEIEIARGGDGWAPIALEWPFGMHEAPPAVLATPAGPVEVRGAIDRVDRSPDGACVVLDYKTGRRPPKPEIDVRFQLPLYVEAFRALGEHGGAERWNAAYYWVANHDHAGPKHALFGSGREASGAELEALRHDVLERIGRVAGAVAAGAFPLTVLPEGTAPCSTCPYRRVCRIDPATVERRRAALHARGGSVYLPGT